MYDIEKHLALLRSKPFIEIEATNTCNLDCIFCPRSNLTREQGMMDQTTFSSIIEKIPHRSKVMFAGMGEPLMNPNLDDFILQVKKRGNIVGITSNGSMLTKKRLEYLIEIKTDFIQISVPVISSKQTDWPYIESILYESKELSLNDTILQLSVVKGNGLPDYTSIVSIAEGCGFKVLEKQKHSRGGNLYDMSSDDINVCGIFPKIVFVAWNGDVLSCCQDLSGVTILGNLKDQNLHEILARKQGVIETNDWFELCFHCDDEYRERIITDSSELE